MHAINPKSTTRFLLTFALCFFHSPPMALCEEVAKCYSPNGDLQIHDVPCNPTTGAGGVSFCCGRGFTCLSNKVCMLSQDTSTGDVTRVGSTYRASCTDKSWNSTECPSFCTKNPYLSINNQAVSSCGDHSWCCQSETADAPYCCTGKDKFTTDPVNENLVVIPAFQTSSNSSSTASTSKPTSTSSTTIVPFSTTSTPTTGLPLSSSTNPTSQSSSSNKAKSQTVALGVGLGIPLAIAVVVGLFFLMRSRARRLHPSGDSNKIEEIGSSTAFSRVAEVSGQQEYELPAERDTPAEMYVKPV